MHELSAFVRRHQIGLAKQIEVIGDARQAHDKVFADFAHGQVPPAQQFEDAAAGRIVQGAKKLGHGYLDDCLIIKLIKRKLLGNPARYAHGNVVR
jgi:hypothetical protein